MTLLHCLEVHAPQFHEVGHNFFSTAHSHSSPHLSCFHLINYRKELDCVHQNLAEHQSLKLSQKLVATFQVRMLSSQFVMHHMSWYERTSTSMGDIFYLFLSLEDIMIILLGPMSKGYKRHTRKTKDAAHGFYHRIRVM